jgi:pimeloyl-ACP methyl ester carboxylesterase
MRDQAADAKALLRELEISRAHFVGYSYGGGVALQLALDSPDLVGSLCLLEPSIPSAPVYVDDIEEIVALYTCGDTEAAVDAFLRQVLGSDYRAALEEHLGPGAFDRVLADSDAGFRVEAESLATWDADVGQVRQPVLAVLGEETVPAAHSVHSTLKAMLPQLEELVIPGTNHAFPFTNRDVVMDEISDFLRRNSL